MTKKNEPPINKLTCKEYDELIMRVEAQNINADDYKIILDILNLNKWLQQQLSSAKLTIKKIKKFFKFTRETTTVKSLDNEEANNKASVDNESIEDDKNKIITDKVTPIQKPHNYNPNANHGRLAAKEYTGCVYVYSKFTDQTILDGFCPKCKEFNTDSKLTFIKTRAPEAFLEGSPIINGKLLHSEHAICRVCGASFKSERPDDLKGKKKYSHSCRTSIAIHHYDAGMPFYRLDAIQKYQGVPLPKSTQSDLMEQLYNEPVKYVVDELQKYAANGLKIYFDDTPACILEYKKSDNKAAHATALISEGKDHKVILFNTNNLTAGKEFEKLIYEREVDNDFLTMSDASSSNFRMLEDDDLLTKWIICLCLSHSRRKFHELLNDDDEDWELKLVLSIISKVYDNDRYCKKNNFNDDERLVYHQEKSASIMESLRVYLTNLFVYKEIEPNSQFGKAANYMLKLWDQLTKFLHVPGAAIDNNLCEQAIKISIRYRKNSLFYKTFHGATIGDSMMSLIHTAKHAGVNIFEYLNKLQEYSEQVKAQPELWLPWNYKDNLGEQIELKKAA